MTPTSRFGVALTVATALACLLAACSDRFRDPNDPRKTPPTATTHTR